MITEMLKIPWMPPISWVWSTAFHASVASILFDQSTLLPLTYYLKSLKIEADEDFNART